MRGAEGELDVSDPADRALAHAASELFPDGFIAVSADGTIDYVNRRAAEICGIAADELCNRDIRVALPLQDMQGRDWWALCDPRRTLSITTGHREKMLILPSGAVVLLTARFLRHPDGRLLATVLGLRDAAARMRAEKAMAELITTVAHELRSPISSITGFTSSLLRHWERLGDEDRQVMIQTVQGDAGRVMRLVTELLDISRIDARSLPLRPSDLDLAGVLTAHVARRVATGEEEGRFELDVPADLPRVWADGDRIEQVLTNLVENALRHGAGQVSVQARPTTTDDGLPGVLIRVGDEGDGIPEPNRELVFSRFWQGGSKSGTGIGLFLVRGIVEAHGGTVRVGEHPSGGAVLEVVLPTGGPHGSGETST